MKKKILICTLVFTLLLSLLVSCGAGAANDLAVRDDMFAPNSKEEALWVETDAAYGYNGGYYADVSDKYVEFEKPIESGSTGANGGDYKEKIIKNVSIAAQTKEYEKSLDGILEYDKAARIQAEKLINEGKNSYIH